MIEFEIKRVPWWWRWQLIRYRRALAVGQGLGDLTGYVRIFAIDHWGARQQVGQPIPPGQARRVLSQLEGELETMSEADWIAGHELRRLNPAPPVRRR